MASKTVLILAAFFQANLSRADDRLADYLRDMRVLACVTAEKAVREQLKKEGHVSFESCASGQFDFDVGLSDRNYLGLNDRDYKVSGYVTVLSRDVGPVVRRFLVSMNHDPGSYEDWGFEVTRIEIGP
jgi:hypothetical protein